MRVAAAAVWSGLIWHRNNLGADAVKQIGRYGVVAIVDGAFKAGDPRPSPPVCAQQLEMTYNLQALSAGQLQDLLGPWGSRRMCFPQDQAQRSPMPGLGGSHLQGKGPGEQRHTVEGAFSLTAGLGEPVPGSGASKAAPGGSRCGCTRGDCYGPRRRMAETPR